MLGHKLNCASLSKIGFSLALMIRNQPILLSIFFKAPTNKTGIQIKRIKYDMKSGRSNCETKHIKLTQDIKFVVSFNFEAKLFYFRTYLISSLYSDWYSELPSSDPNIESDLAFISVKYTNKQKIKKILRISLSFFPNSSSSLNAAT